MGHNAEPFGHVEVSHFEMQEKPPLDVNSLLFGRCEAWVLYGFDAGVLVRCITSFLLWFEPASESRISATGVMSFVCATFFCGTI